MTDTGQGQRMYGVAPTSGGYHPPGPTAVSYNGVGDPQGPGIYRHAGPPATADYQPGQFYAGPAGALQRPHGAGVYPKSTGMRPPGWTPTAVRYPAPPPPQAPTLNQLLQGSAADAWMAQDYGQTVRPMMDAVGTGWTQQPHLASPTGPSSYANRLQPMPQNSTQVNLLPRAIVLKLL